MLGRVNFVMGRALLAQPHFHTQERTVDTAPGDGLAAPKLFILRARHSGSHPSGPEFQLRAGDRFPAWLWKDSGRRGPEGCSAAYWLGFGRFVGHKEVPAAHWVRALVRWYRRQQVFLRACSVFRSFPRLTILFVSHFPSLPFSSASVRQAL